MADLLKGNEDQQKAIILNQGPALILAGPGSGKTFTIVERIRYLITHHGVNAENILVITFTKAAARQMRDRFWTRMGSMACPVNFGTFHAVFYHILRISAPHNSGAVLSEKEKKEYLQRVLAIMPAKEEFPADSEWESGLLAEFGFIKNAGHIPEGFSSAYLDTTTFKRAFVEFQRLLVQEDKWDFDDFAARCLHLFQCRPDILKEWQEHYRYILVDEFQDINPAQYEVTKLLAGARKNLFVVGDDDQSIYGFRAASPAIMKQFLHDYPQSAQIKLSVNYRCAPGIVHRAGLLIGVNQERFEKNITAGKCGDKNRSTMQAGPEWKSYSEDNSVWIGSFLNRAQQAEKISGCIRELYNSLPKEASENFSAAVIFRTNTDALPVAEVLSRQGIPFFLQEKVKSPYDHFVCQDLLAYLKFIYQGEERKDFYRVMNKPCRYLSRQAVSGRQVFWEELLDFYRDKNWMLPYIRRFWADTERIRGMDLYAAVHYIRKGVGYDQWLSGKLQGEALKNAFVMADFFRESVRQFQSLEQFCGHVDSYERNLEESNRNKGMIRPGQVALLTMHGAKGLEFDHVFLPDCNEGVTPHKKSMKAGEIEEERRMFYVGMTRAKISLHISWIAGTQDDPGFPSRFLGDLGYQEPWRKS